MASCDYCRVEITHIFLIADFLQVPRSINATLGPKVNFNCIPYYYISLPQRLVVHHWNRAQTAKIYRHLTVQITVWQKFNNTLVHCRIHDRQPYSTFADSR